MNAPSGPSVVHIHDPEQFRGATSRQIWRARHRHDQLHLELPMLTAAENTYWSGRLNSPYRACGCPWAALGLALGLSGYLIYLSSAKGLASSGWPEAGIGLLVLGVGSAIGKLLGIVWARARFSQSLRDLANVTSARADQSD